MVDKGLCYLEELLPGIEDFLCTSLAAETLSATVEERRQYYVERLDILKLPPSVPPRVAKKTENDLNNPPPEKPEPVPDLPENPPPVPYPPEADPPPVPDDFAAHQRELSRSLLSSVKKDIDGEESEEEQIKVYDDIDIDREQNDDEDDEEQGWYEIPVTSTSHDDLAEDAASLDGHLDTEAPPLPPRDTDATRPDSCRHSTGSLDPPELPARPNLPKRNEVYSLRSDRSEKSEANTADDLTDDGSRTSYESYNDDQDHDSALLAKLNIKLPKQKLKKKHKTKLSKSHSSSIWEVCLPFKKLENVTIYGELQYRGKISWSRKLVAISNGQLICYKPGKHCRPVLAIPLIGYDATYSKRDLLKGYEIKMTHPNAISHHFAVDSADWAQRWCECIIAAAEGKAPPDNHLTLSRSASNPIDKSFDAKTGSRGSLSNLSNISSDTGSHDILFRDRADSSSSSKPARGMSFAHRASQFFKQPSKRHLRKLTMIGIPFMDRLSSASSTTTTSSIASPTTPMSPISPEDSVFVAPEEPNMYIGVKHKGFLNIFSSFNKRRWGKRWCMVIDNMFECYKTEESTVCEMNFFLSDCEVKRAVEETKSELGLMITLNKVEKITVEPLSEEDMSKWLMILMKESSTRTIPAGLEAYAIEDPYEAIDWEEEYKVPMPEAAPTTPQEETNDDETEVSTPVVEMRVKSEDEDDFNLHVDPSRRLSHTAVVATGDVYTQMQLKAPRVQSLGKGDNPTSTRTKRHRRKRRILSLPETIAAKQSDTNAINVQANDKQYSENKNNIEEDKSDKSEKLVELSRAIENNVENITDKCVGDIKEIKQDIMLDYTVHKSHSSDSSISESAHDRPNSSYVMPSLDSNIMNDNDISEFFKSWDDKMNISSSEVRTSDNNLIDETPPLDNCMEISSTVENEKKDLEKNIARQMIQKSIARQIQITTASPSDDELNSNPPRQRSPWKLRKEVRRKHDSLDMDSDITESLSETESTSEREANRSSADLSSPVYDMDAMPTTQQQLERLRVKLVDLKKNRICIRDKKHAAINEEDREIYEKEYLRLARECKVTDKEISILEGHDEADNRSILVQTNDNKTGSPVLIHV